MRIVIGLVILLSTTASLTACADQSSDPRSADAVIVGDPVALTRLRAEPYSLTYYSGMQTPRRLVVRDAATWRATWSEIWGSMSPTPPLPEVDFTREMVVVAAMGSHSTGGYGILLDTAVATGSGITVRVRSTSPGRTCVVTMAFSQPVDAARLPRSDAPVRFAEVARVFDCA